MDMKKLTLSALLLCFGVFACRASGTPTLPATSLADTSWALVSYGQPGSPTTVPDDRNITLNFRGLGGYDGSTGLNHYGGGSRFEGNKLNIQRLTRTQLTDPVGDAYLSLLMEAETLEYRTEELIINCRGGEKLVFRPA